MEADVKRHGYDRYIAAEQRIKSLVTQVRAYVDRLRNDAEWWGELEPEPEPLPQPEPQAAPRSGTPPPRRPAAAGRGPGSGQAMLRLALNAEAPEAADCDVDDENVQFTREHKSQPALGPQAKTHRRWPSAYRQRSRA